jgi:SAM-dependent methyltransferase
MTGIKELKIKIIKGLVKTVGMTSTGIRMSFEYGFTSGKTLDYIYANKASGKYGIGILLDRMYLSHRGWRVIRQRKQNLETLMQEALNRLAENEKPFQIMDIASGPGRYMLDVAGRNRDKNLRILCRDFDPRWVEEGNQKARSEGLENVTFEQADAFDEKSYEPLRRSQDLVIASGFYDWITEDAKVRKSMALVFGAVRDGGYFVFTNQSGHVDMEMVTRIFVDFNQQPLQMTVRSAEQMNGWTQEAGFQVIRTLSDKWGYYSVTLAVKKP